MSANQFIYIQVVLVVLPHSLRLYNEVHLPSFVFRLLKNLRKHDFSECIFDPMIHIYLFWRNCNQLSCQKPKKKAFPYKYQLVLLKQKHWKAIVVGNQGHRPLEKYIYSWKTWSGWDLLARRKVSPTLYVKRPKNIYFQTFKFN